MTKPIDIIQGSLLCQFSGTKTLITGGLGFIGSNLARALLRAGARVHLYDSLFPKCGGLQFNIRDINDSVEVTLADLRDKDALSVALKDVQFIFNLAGQSNHWDSMIDPLTDLQVNCNAQLNLLEVIRHTNPNIRIIFASTRQIYGIPKYLPVDENHPLCPVDINGIHKVASEAYHILYNRVYGIGCTIVRLTNTIGPGMRIKDARQTFAGLWLRLAIEGQPFEVWGGRQIRDFNFVDDVIDALLLAASAEKPGCPIYNLGSAPTTLQEFADILRNITGCEYVVKPFPNNRKSIDIGHYYANYNRIRDELGWMPRTSVQEAIIRTVQYYKQHIQHYV